MRHLGSSRVGLGRFGPRNARKAAAGLVLSAALLVALGAPAAAASQAPPSGVFNVTQYGATGDGVTDATNAVAAAIAAAQSHGGGTVFFPAGVYAFTKNLGTIASAIQVHGTVPITLAGAASATTALVDHVAGQSLLSVRVDGSTVQDLTLDTQTYNAGTAIGVQANNTTLQRAVVLGGSNKFALYYTGPGGATPTNPAYNSGNQVLNTSINDNFSGDGFSFSFQQNGLIQNITHRGSRIALYVDQNVTVNGDLYSPGSQSGGTDGFWITPPSSGISIDGFHSSGRGGIIGSGNPKSSSNIAINDEELLSPSGYHLDIGNVNGLTISGSSFNAANSLRVAPSSSATNVSVQSSSIPAIRFSDGSGAQVGISFTGTTFPALTLNGKPAPTFQSTPSGQNTVTISGGTWGNKAGGFSKGTNMAFSVSNLIGYP